LNYVKIKNINYETSINYLILFYAFCLPISRAGVAFATIMLMLLWILQTDYKRKFEEIRHNYLIVAIFVFILYSALAITWSSDKLFALEYIKKYYHFLIIPIIYTSLKKEYIDRVFSAFLLGMLISEITSYGIFFELWTKAGVSPHDPSPFMDRSNYSTYLAFTAFILMHKIIYTKDLKWRVVYGLFFIFSTSNLFINGGRTGQFAFLIALCFIGFLSFENKIRATIGTVLLATVIFSAAYTISPVFKDRFDYFIEDTSQMLYEQEYKGGFSYRVALWKTGLEASTNNLLFGTGIGDEALYAKQILDKYKVENLYGSVHTENYIDFHNAFIQYLVQLGITGFLIFLSIFYFLARLKIKEKMYKNLHILFLILYINHSMLGSSFHINQSMVMFVLFSSMFLLINKYEN
jgi:O-antigen ligase